MKTIFNWLFSKTAAGKLIDGYKTQISFLIWLATYVVEGIVKAAAFFPGLESIAASAEGFLAQLMEQIRKLAEIGIVIGVGHKAIKEKTPSEG